MAYADDVTILTDAHDHPRTNSAVHRLQPDLGTFTELLVLTGMEVFVMKTHYLVVRGNQTNHARIHLTMAVHNIQPALRAGSAYWVYPSIKMGEPKSG